MIREDIIQNKIDYEILIINLLINELDKNLKKTMLVFKLS